MIDWIKFKGSTEEEKGKEINNFPALVSHKHNGEYIEPIYLESKEDLDIYSFDDECIYWAPLNLPQEEKWERQEDFDGFTIKEFGCILEGIGNEFDNLYSIVNQLKDELRKI